MHRPPISHLATSTDGDLFATATFERSVTVWSLKQRQLVAAFNTVLDFGGVRLAMAGGERPKVIAGAYLVHGVAGYDALSGEIVWHRKDLKGVQQVSVCEETRKVAVGLERGPLHVLDLETGETFFTFRGAKSAAIDPSGIFLVGKKWVAMANLDGSSRWRVRVEFWGSFQARIAPHGVLVTLLGGKGTVCFDLASGREKWIYSRSGWGVRDARWCERDQVWRAVDCRFGGSSVGKIVDLDVNGQKAAEHGEVTAVEIELMRGGEFLATSEGRVLRLPSLESEWNFG